MAATTSPTERATGFYPTCITPIVSPIVSRFQRVHQNHPSLLTKTAIATTAVFVVTFTNYSPIAATFVAAIAGASFRYLDTQKQHKKLDELLLPTNTTPTEPKAPRNLSDPLEPGCAAPSKDNEIDNVTSFIKSINDQAGETVDPKEIQTLLEQTKTFQQSSIVTSEVDALLNQQITHLTFRRGQASRVTLGSTTPRALDNQFIGDVKPINLRARQLTRDYSIIRDGVNVLAGASFWAFVGVGAGTVADAFLDSESSVGLSLALPAALTGGTINFIKAIQARRFSPNEEQTARVISSVANTVPQQDLDDGYTTPSRVPPSSFIPSPQPSASQQEIDKAKQLVASHSKLLDDLKNCAYSNRNYLVQEFFNAAAEANLKEPEALTLIVKHQQKLQAAINSMELSFVDNAILADQLRKQNPIRKDPNQEFQSRIDGFEFTKQTSVSTTAAKERLQAHIKTIKTEWNIARGTKT